MHNGTAATFVGLEDYSIQVALDPEPLRKAREEEGKQSNIASSSKRCRVSLSTDMICLRFMTPMAMHRMRRARKTKLYPLATPNVDEGNAGQNINILYDLLVFQLGRPPDEVEKLFVMVGPVCSREAVHPKELSPDADCPHGYHRYGWVLPLIQLWHRGLADLGRILERHWGGWQAQDPSGFCHEHSPREEGKALRWAQLLSRQHIGFGTLKAQAIDCWRVKFGVSDLDQHFKDRWVTLVLSQLYMPESSAENALVPIPCVLPILLAARSGQKRLVC
ncbi:hypothetical protein FIBSPDRAFT_933772 [Athelia psychrophila]|uniref:DUF6589 domain-containing protein n=1 Tax=Athelia psychrophila TaxID=1759441 RepID=A0A166GH54_9AGAM|nr:hypothetical protein FIBSPDRAFT_933772 [Fibularhizoctonia sp. CBS 109695]